MSPKALIVLTGNSTKLEAIRDKLMRHIAWHSLPAVTGSLTTGDTFEDDLRRELRHSIEISADVTVIIAGPTNVHQRESIQKSCIFNRMKPYYIEILENYPGLIRKTDKVAQTQPEKQPHQSILEIEGASFSRHIFLLGSNSQHEGFHFGHIPPALLPLKQFIMNINDEKPRLYLLANPEAAPSPTGAATQRGLAFAHDVARMLSGKTIRVYSGTEISNIDLTNAIITSLKPLTGSNKLDHGFCYIEELSAAETTIKLERFIPPDAISATVEHPLYQEYLKSMRFNTDTMPRHLIEELIIRGHDRIAHEVDWRSPLWKEESKSNIMRRLEEILLEITTQREPKMVIASNSIISMIASYFGCVTASEEFTLYEIVQTGDQFTLKVALGTQPE